MRHGRQRGEAECGKGAEHGGRHERARNALRRIAREKAAAAARAKAEAQAEAKKQLARQDPYADPAAPYKTNRLASPKFPEPIVNTPRSVTVLTQEVLRDKDATSVKDAIRTTPGVTIGTGEGGLAFGDRFFVRGFDVRTPSIDVRAFTLSGGNQQKLIVGREMLAKPTVLIAAHPTRGVDVGAQAVIWELLKDARAEGLGIVLISADLDELIGLSDTLHVMLRGSLVATVDPARVTPEELGGYMTGAHTAAGAA